MNSLKLRYVALAAFLFIVPSIASAQSAAQAQAMLQANPGLLRELRSRIMSSGLTPDQVRARLRAEGYPENLLDAYLSGGTESGVEDQGTTGAPTDQAIDAVSQLGIVDTVDATRLRCSVEALTSDTVLTAADTLGIGREAALARRRALRQRCSAQLPPATAADSLRLRQARDSGYIIFGINTFRQQSHAVRPEPQWARG